MQLRSEAPNSDVQQRRSLLHRGPQRGSFININHTIPTTSDITVEAYLANRKICTYTRFARIYLSFFLPLRSAAINPLVAFNALLRTMTRSFRSSRIFIRNKYFVKFFNGKVYLSKLSIEFLLNYMVIGIKTMEIIIFSSLLFNRFVSIVFD